MILSSLFLFAASASVASAPATVEDAYCEADRITVRRAWSLYMAEVPPSEDQAVANGAKLMGLGALMMPCDTSKADSAKVDLTPLSKEEIARLREFAPEGSTVGWARCLSRAAPEKTMAFLEGTDRVALQQYVTSRAVGGFDEEAFVALASTDECAAEYMENVKSQQLYEDLNWFGRIEPMLNEIIDWHEGKIDA